MINLGFISKIEIALLLKVYTAILVGINEAMHYSYLTFVFFWKES